MALTDRLPADRNPTHETMPDYGRNPTEMDSTESTTDDNSETADSDIADSETATTDASELDAVGDKQAPPSDGPERRVDGGKWRRRLAQLEAERDAAADPEKSALTDKIEDLQARMRDAGVPTDASTGEPSPGGDSPAADAGSHDQPPAKHPSDDEPENGDEDTDATLGAGGNSRDSPNNGDALPGESAQEVNATERDTADSPSDTEPITDSTTDDAAKEIQVTRTSPSTSTSDVDENPTNPGEGSPDESTEETRSGSTDAHEATTPPAHENDQPPANDPASDSDPDIDSTGQEAHQASGTDAPPTSPASNSTDESPIDTTPEASSGKSATGTEATQDTDPSQTVDSEWQLDVQTGADTESGDGPTGQPSSDAQCPPQDDSEGAQSSSSVEASDSTDDSEGVAAEVSALQTQVETLETNLAEYRRKNEREHEILQKEAVEQLAERMLRVRDTLNRAIEYNEFDDGQTAMLEAVVTKFDQQLTAGAIDMIDPDPGDAVDDLRHALAGPREETTAVPSGCIIRVERPGFEIDGYPLQEAEVIAATRD